MRMDLTDLFNSDDKWHDGMERLETLVNDLENQKETMGESKEAFRRALDYVKTSINLWIS